MENELNATVLLIGSLVIGYFFMALYARQEHQDAERQRRRADELAAAAVECQLDNVDLHRRLQQQRQRHADLQALYALRVRQLLAGNFDLIAGNLQRKRSRRSGRN